MVDFFLRRNAIHGTLLAMPMFACFVATGGSMVVSFFADKNVSPWVHESWSLFLQLGLWLFAATHASEAILGYFSQHWVTTWGKVRVAWTPVHHESGPDTYHLDIRVSFSDCAGRQCTSNRVSFGVIRSHEVACTDYKRENIFRGADIRVGDCDLGGCPKGDTDVDLFTAKVWYLESWPGTAVLVPGVDQRDLLFTCCFRIQVVLFFSVLIWLEAT